jgi:hypothetical protein
MTQQEYEQKKRECWENVKFALRAPNTAREVFEFIFDRAYALGKEKETITQEEIEEAAEKYADPSRTWASGAETQEIKDAFKAGANFALGKQEKDADTVISGWVARDEDGQLPLFVASDKPYKKKNCRFWCVNLGRTFEFLPENTFPDLTWESESEPVGIIIKRKKK